jgi:hypothetical protein
MHQSLSLFEMKVGLTWIDPMPEPESIVVWATSEVEYDTQDDESGDGEYLWFNAMNMECPCQSGFLTLTLMEANQNSHSPYALAPNRLMIITTTKHIVYTNS